MGADEEGVKETLQVVCYLHIVGLQGEIMKNKVKEMREERGWSQGELAKRLNVSRQTVISIEKERYNPSLDLAFSLADLFERRIEDIFTPNRTNEEGIE